METLYLLIDPNAPRSVLVLGDCLAVVWRPPRRAYGTIIGYDVHFFIVDTPLSRIVRKERDEFHHLISEGDMLSGSGQECLSVQVSKLVRQV
jgi:hypothetical protein